MKKDQKTGVVAMGCSGLGLAMAVFGLGWTSSTYAGPVNLGSAANYAVVAVGGSSGNLSDFEIYQSATVINGNVSEGPYNTLTHGMDATVHGVWNYDQGGTDVPNPPGPVTGTIDGGLVPANTAQVSSDALAASVQAAGLNGSSAGVVSYSTLSTLNNGDVINLTAGGINVIRISDPVSISGGGTTLTINGAANASVVFQLVSGAAGVTLNLSGTTMSLLGGVTPDNIIWDLDGYSAQKQDVSITSGATVYGILLAPERNVIIDHGNILGAVIGGGGGNIQPGLSIHSGSTITSIVPDGGLTLILLGLALGGLSLFRTILRNPVHA